MKPLTIKISHPEYWGKNFYLEQSPNQSGFWDGNKFEILNGAKNCDFWIIHEGVSEIETANCAKQNCILITGEEKSKKNYDQKYLNQFGCIVTTRDDLFHENIIKWHYICPWHILKTYDEANNTEAIQKQNNLSAICSDETGIDGHKKRFAFINKMIGHFKDKIHVYGRGFNYIEDKYQGLAPYKYSIAIEHSVFHDYWSEKITDCYLSLTMPIYYGCPNILDYFPAESMIAIDINDYKKSILSIEKAIDENHYEKFFDSVLRSKKMILSQYNMFPAIINIINKYNNRFAQQKGQTTIYPERYFPEKHLMAKSKYFLKKIIGKI